MGVFGSILGGVVGGIPGAIAGADWGGTKKWLLGDDAAKQKSLEAQNFQLQGGNMLRDYAQGQFQGAQGRQAPTSQAYQLGNAAQLAGGPQDQWRQQQMALAGQMAGVAGGQQMGAGQTNMARGANAGIMARAAARGLGDLGVNAAGAAGQSALQDQSNARGQLAGLLGQGRGADLDLAGQNAQLQQQRNLMQGQFGQQTNLANQSAQLQQSGMNDAYGLGMMGQYANISAQELQARLARAGLLGQDQGHLGALLQAGGQIAAAV